MVTKTILDFGVFSIAFYNDNRVNKLLPFKHKRRSGTFKKHNKTVMNFHGKLQS